MELKRMKLNRLLLACLATSLLCFASTSTAHAAGIPVRVDMTHLFCIQTYNLDKKATDDVYMLVTGVVKGEEFSKRLPEKGTWPASHTKLAVQPEKPVVFWEGELDRGEFALVTVTLMHGKGEDAARLKTLLDKKAEGEKKVAVRSRKTLSSTDEFAKLHGETLEAHRKLIIDIKSIFPARKGEGDHYGGQFTVVVWNEDGELVKRLDPVGLTL